MGPFQAIKTGFAKSMLFEGRASRSEFWRAFSFSILAAGVFQIFAFVAVFSQLDESVPEVGQTALRDLFGLNIIISSLFIFYIVMLPTIARRFKDCGRKGHWFEYAAYMNWVSGCFAFVGLCFTLLRNHEMAQTLGLVGLVSVFIPHSFFMLALWIGFVPSNPLSNQYGPNPYNKYGPNPHEVPS